jgi:hypothetical protein
MERRTRTYGDRAVGAAVGVLGVAVFVATAQRVFTFDAWEGRVPEGYSLSSVTLWLMFIAAAAGVVVVHEAGHAVAGALVGFRPFRVVVGGGPTLARFPIGSTNVELHAFPFTGGLTEMGTRHPRALWSRHAFAVIGGPLAPVLAAVVLMRWEPATIDLEVMRLSAITVVVYTSIMSLVPYRSGGMQSDGMHLVECVTQRPDTHRRLLLAHDALELRDAMEASDTRRLASLRTSTDPVIASIAAIAARDWDDAVGIARSGLDVAHSEQVIPLRNGLAYALAQRSAPGDLDEALTVAALLDPSTDGPAVSDTVGLVLLRAGRAAEALPHLRSAHDDPTLLAPARAEVAAHLAEAAYATGDAHLGRKALARALRDGGAESEVDRALATAAEREAEVIRGFWEGTSGGDDDRATELIAALGDSAQATIAALGRASAGDPELATIADALRRARGRRVGR